MTHDAVVAAQVEAAATLLAMPLPGERRGAVIAAMVRLAAFAADVAAVELADDVAIAAEFVP